MIPPRANLDGCENVCLFNSVEMCVCACSLQSTGLECSCELQ